MLKLLENYHSAFQQCGSLSLSSDVSYDGRLLGSIISLCKKVVGYSCNDIEDKGSDRVVLVSEVRHLPYLVYRRSSSSAPLINFEFSQSSIDLYLLGPLNEERRCPFFKIHIPLKDSLESCIDSDRVYDTQFEVNGFSVGVHTWEQLLRTPNIDVHRGWSDASEVLRANWRKSVGRNGLRVLFLQWLFANIPSALLYVGHDCYYQAIDVNIAISRGIPTLLLPKGKPNHLYTSYDSPGYWEQGRPVFHSHLLVWLSEQMKLRWKSVNASFITDAKSEIKGRLEDLSTLSYMRIDSETYVGYELFRQESGLPEYQPDCSDGSNVAWIFSFHSFSDEACIWGMDRLNSLYMLFLNAARAIITENPEDLVVVRPHPNYYRFFSEDLIARISENDLKGLTTTHFDSYLQLRLCQEILALGGNVRLSGPSPTSKVLEYEKTVVVTRNGNIVVEAAWLGRPSVFSVIAPYGFLFPESLQFRNNEGLLRALNTARHWVFGQAGTLPSKEDLARYMAILETPRGLKKGPKGGLSNPISAVEAFKSFDDFSYPRQTVAATLDRILHCYDSEDEKSLFRMVAGLEN